MKKMLREPDGQARVCKTRQLGSIPKRSSTDISFLTKKSFGKASTSAALEIWDGIERAAKNAPKWASKCVGSQVVRQRTANPLS